jgi:hypothetical protein
MNSVRAASRPGRSRGAARANGLPTPRSQRICKKCGAANLPAADECKECGSARLAPSWVLARREVTKQFEVQITSSNEQFGPPQARITFSKWWPGSGLRSPTLHIPTPEQWARVRDIVDSDFGPRIGWTRLASRAALPTAPITKKQLRELVRQHPDVATSALAEELGPSFGIVSPEAVELVERISKEAAKLGKPFIDAYRKLVEELPKHGGVALVELQRILESWSLHQVVQITAEVRRRLDTIDLFEKMVLDETTYEIRGDKSIHRVLETAMWIVDERYWLMSSNATLRSLIGQAIAKEPKHVQLRPDFSCAQLDKQGVIIELKRPSHDLAVSDLNQAERYLLLAEKFMPNVTWKAILIGQAAADDTRRTLRYRTSVDIRTFTDLLGDARHRYEEYLKIARAEPGSAADKAARRRAAV